MSYDTSNPPNLIVPGAPGSAAVWLYSSLDAHGTVEGAAYFSNALKIGMKLADIVIVVKSDTGATTIHSVTAFAYTDVAGWHSTGTATISPATFT
jgi:hypothetical protein